MNRSMIALALASLALASGCSSLSTPPHACPLSEPSARCASVEETYAAAQGEAKTGAAGHRQSVFDARPATTAATTPTAAPQPFFADPSPAVPAPGQLGAPVFQQPRVMRVWVAPYVDADGNLRSGEYTYFSTPGQWNYGATRRTGQAAGAFGPVRPDALGFTPVTPPKPGAGTPPKPGAEPAGAAEPVQSITQPYQRLVN
jgi:conjugal transfer pilus assembly protein TraV